MKYILDTQAFIWWIEDDKKLNRELKSVISSSSNAIFLSVVSAWEMSIKMRRKKLRLKTTWEDCFGSNLEFELLDITLVHLNEYHKLPLLHKDPFDRMLIAQAKVEKCTLITADPKIRRYDVPTL